MFKMLISSLCLIILLGTSQSEELSADEILTLVMNQTYGLNHTFRLSIIKKQNSKPDKKQVINISFLWPKEGPYLRKSFVETLEPKNLKGVRFWEHTYKVSKLSKRWITLPVTGKLKDVTDKKPNKNEFNFSELELTQEIINNHTNTILENTKIDGRPIIVIESIEKNNKKNSKKIWIDQEEYFIHKVEYFTKRGRKNKIIEMHDLIKIDNLTFPRTIKIQDLRKKISYSISISNIDLYPNYNLDDFNPDNVMYEKN